MIRKIPQSTLTLLSGGAFYLLLTIIWSLVSLKIHCFESQNGYFGIYTLLQFKILLPIAVFMGRFLLFNKYQLGSSNPWFFPLGLFLVGSSVFDKLTGAINVFYLFLIALDIMIWAFLIKEMVGTISAIFSFWKVLPKVNYAMFTDIWAKVGKDLIKLGIWLTFLIGLIFFYLVSFFMVDALLYSYLLLIPLFGCSVSLYGLIFLKVKAWVHSDLTAIDDELAGQLNWDQAKDDPDLPQKVTWFQYLTLIRNYLKSLQRPVLSLKLFILYLGCSGFILSLPYFFGRVIEV